MNVCFMRFIIPYLILILPNMQYKFTSFCSFPNSYARKLTKKLRNQGEFEAYSLTPPHIILEEKHVSPSSLLLSLSHLISSSISHLTLKKLHTLSLSLSLKTQKLSTPSPKIQKSHTHSLHQKISSFVFGFKFHSPTSFLSLPTRWHPNLHPMIFRKVGHVMRVHHVQESSIT